MNKIIYGAITLAIMTSASLHASNASDVAYLQGVAAKSYCGTKWTMTFWKDNENGKVCEKLGKKKWMQSCARAYSKIDSPSRDQITAVAKKQWNLK